MKVAIQMIAFKQSNSCSTYYSEMRLVGGSNSCQGRLEGRDSNLSEFGQACYFSVSRNEATVVCRQLGCPVTAVQSVDAGQ